MTAHTGWLQRDGAPANIAAIAQTTDGFLWVGTPFGLFRFDGAQFASYPMTWLEKALPSNDISALLSDGQGGLWIGFHAGGISHLGASGSMDEYSHSAGRGPASAQKFVYGKDGTLWAIGEYHLYRFQSGRWESFGKTHGLPDDPLFALFVDRDGTLWVSTRGHLFSMKQGDAGFEPYPTKTFLVVDMVQMPDGEIWICDAWRTVRPLNAARDRAGWRINGYVRLAIEKSGNLWLAQDYRGVTHLAWRHTSSALIKEQELTSEQTNAIFVDRDSNIWVGTSRGLDRFHSTQVKHLTNARVEYYPAMCAARTGGVWLATLARPIVYASNDVLHAYGKAVGSAPIVCRDDGSVWMVDPLTSKLTGWMGVQFLQSDLPPGVHVPAGTVIGLDRDGALLITFRAYGLWRFDGAWERVLDPDLPQEEPSAIYRDPHGRVWLGYEDGRIASRDTTGSHTFIPSAENNLGKVMVFAMVDDHVFAAGTNGASYLDGGTFRKISLARQGVLRGVSGMVQDYTGSLWLNTSAGLYRLPASQLRSNLHDAPEYERFDDRQGIEGTATQRDPVPSLALDRAGPLWISTSGSASEINPESTSQHLGRPLLTIERVLLNSNVLGDREHPVTHVRFTASKLKELEIDYAGVDLSAPENIRYRYMMAGKDSSWQEVGDRRQAFYDHLAPGHYTFRVAESNDIGQWAERSASLAIVVRPAFYETYWFRALVALAFASVLYLAYSLRVHMLTNTLRANLQERANERLRISRELHDTLLQSVHGLMLRFHFATSELPEDEPARESLQIALQRADVAFLEARQRIELLREEVPDVPNFSEQLFQIAQELDIQSRLDFFVGEEGESKVIIGKVQTELGRIAREALINIMNHAEATKAQITLSYSATELRMCCIDNGIGLPAEILREGRRAGHWGLVGLAERAATINGRLHISNASEGGTRIEVSVPAGRAYRDRRKWLKHFNAFGFPA